jgi:hypothetical protein
MGTSCAGCKKVVATGARTLLLMREERCFGQMNEDADGTNMGAWKRMDLLSESVVNNITTFVSESLNPERAIKRRMQGTSAVGGDVNVELSNNGHAWMIVQALGKIVGAGTAGDPYTILPVDSNGVAKGATAGYKQTPAKYDLSHEITYDPNCCGDPGYADGYYTVDEYNLEPGMDILISRDGGTIKDEFGNDPVNHLWFLYTGMKVNTWSVTASATEILKSTFGLLGRAEDYDYDVAIPTYSEAPEVNDPFSGFNGAVEIDGESKCILSFEFSLNNNLNTDKFCIGDRFRNSLPEALKEITGTITMEFTDLMFYKKFIDGTSAILTVEFDLLGDGTEKMKFILPKIEFNGTTPTAGSRDAMNQELPFTAMWDDAPADTILVKGATLTTPDGFDIAVEIVTAGTLV